MALRDRIFGDGAMLSTSRFMYHAAGGVSLIHWDKECGYFVRLLSASDVQAELALDVAWLRAAPMRIDHAILDHHCGSYATALRSAAASLTKRQRDAAGVAQSV